MAGYTLTPLPRIGITPLGGSLIYTYAAGTSTPLATYTDDSGGTASGNPVVADGNGLFPAIYLPVGTNYKFVCTQPVTNGLLPDPITNIGITIWTQSGVASVPTSSTAVDLTGTAGESIAINQAVYLSDGSGGKTAGQWYKADNSNAYSSATNLVAMAVNAVSSGAVGTFRVAGQLSGLAGLLSGSLYYVGTAGAITTTAANSVRLIGQADSTTTIQIATNPPSTVIIDNTICDFRLTLTTAVPVTVSDVLAAGTLFCSPYKGNRIALYDGTAVWNIRTSAEFSIAVPALTSQMYDVFCYDNAGTPTLELLAWTNDTTRATALTTQDGVLVKTGAVTRRYMGSMRTTAVANQTEDSFKKRYLWNYYNRVMRGMRVLDAANSWALNSATYVQADSAANQLDFIIGFAEVLVDGQVLQAGLTYSTGGWVFTAIGEDSTTVADANCLVNPAFTANASLQINTGGTASLRKYPAVGRHTWVWLNQLTGGGTATMYGTNASDGRQSGIHGSLMG